jgi:hypothetical protein
MIAASMDNPPPEIDPLPLRCRERNRVSQKSTGTRRFSRVEGCLDLVVNERRLPAFAAPAKDKDWSLPQGVFDLRLPQLAPT